MNSPLVFFSGLPIAALINQNVKIFSSGVIFDSVLVMGGQSCNGPIGLTHLPHATPTKQFNVTYGFPFKNSISRNNAKGRSPLEEMGMCFFFNNNNQDNDNKESNNNDNKDNEDVVNCPARLSLYCPLGICINHLYFTTQTSNEI